MGNLNGNCSEDQDILKEYQLSSFEKTMKTYKQTVLLNNESKFNQSEQNNLLNYMKKMNYVILDYVCFI